MPTSVNEATTIVKITQEFLPLEKAVEFAVRLDEEVGQHTDNSSLKVTLRMLRTALESGLEALKNNYKDLDT